MMSQEAKGTLEELDGPPQSSHKYDDVHKQLQIQKIRIESLEENMAAQEARHNRDMAAQEERHNALCAQIRDLTQFPSWWLCLAPKSSRPTFERASYSNLKHSYGSRCQVTNKVVKNHDELVAAHLCPRCLGSRVSEHYTFLENVDDVRNIFIVRKKFEDLFDDLQVAFVPQLMGEIGYWIVFKVVNSALLTERVTLDSEFSFGDLDGNLICKFGKIPSFRICYHHALCCLRDGPKQPWNTKSTFRTFDLPKIQNLEELSPPMEKKVEIQERISREREPELKSIQRNLAYALVEVTARTINLRGILEDLPDMRSATPGESVEPANKQKQPIDQRPSKNELSQTTESAENSSGRTLKRKAETDAEP